MDGFLNVLFFIVTLIIAPLALYCNKNYIKKKLIHKEATTDDLRFYNGLSERIPLGSIGGIGFTFCGDFRNYRQTEVSYLFFALFIPIIPIGCYRVSMGSSRPLKYGGTSASYRIYGEDSWRFWEVLSIYIDWYSWVLIGFGVLAIFMHMS